MSRSKKQRKKQVYHIYCEGQTEIAYFEKLKKLYNLVDEFEFQKPLKSNAIKIINNIEKKNIKKKVDDDDDDDVYIACFDIDDMATKKKQDYNDIRDRLNKKGCKQIDYYLVSNRQFESWLQWHFDEKIPWKNDSPGTEEKEALCKKIPNITKDQVQNAIQRAEKYNTSYYEDLPFSTCYLIEDIWSKVKSSEVKK